VSLLYGAWMLFVVVLGACVGSFMNMLVYRLPENKPLLRPMSSACPVCGHNLAWFENLPIVAWIVLRGRCRYCKTGISIRYPLIELTCASMYALMFWAYFESGWLLTAPLRPTWHDLTPVGGWPGFLVHLVLATVLLASTLIDLKYFIIPLVLPYFAVLATLIGLPLAAVLWPDSIPGMVRLSGGWLGPLAGAFLGLILANALLMFGLLPRSFDIPSEENWQKFLADHPLPEDATEADLLKPEHWYIHPYPRLEVLKECLFLALPAVGFILAWRYGLSIPTDWLGEAEGGYPAWAEALAGSGMGFLIGGLIVWAVRILGTLGFGKEAMGLGDVHLLAAIGALLGWKAAVVIFFLAPFPGIFFAVVVVGMVRISSGRKMVIPYGPFLAITALVMMVACRPVEHLLAWLKIPMSLGC